MVWEVLTSWFRNLMDIKLIAGQDADFIFFDLTDVALISTHIVY